MWGETEGLMLLFWSALFVGGREIKCERWGVVRWRGGKSGRVVRWKGGKGEGGWQGGKGRRVIRWEGNEAARWGRWESGKVRRWGVPDFFQGWGM